MESIDLPWSEKSQRFKSPPFKKAEHTIVTINIILNILALFCYNNNNDESINITNISINNALRYAPIIIN